MIITAAHVDQPEVLLTAAACSHLTPLASTAKTKNVSAIILSPLKTRCTLTRCWLFSCELQGGHGPVLVVGWFFTVKLRHCEAFFNVVQLKNLQQEAAFWLILRRCAGSKICQEGVLFTAHFHWAEAWRCYVLVFHRASPWAAFWQQEVQLKFSCLQCQH